MRGTRPMTAEFLPPHRTGLADLLHPALGVPFFGLLPEFCHLVCLSRKAEVRWRKWRGQAGFFRGSGFLFAGGLGKRASMRSRSASKKARSFSADGRATR